MLFRKIIVLLFLLLLCSCSTRVGDLSIVSPNNVNLKKVNLDELPQRKNVTGEDTKSIVLFFPLGQPTLEEAVSDALRKGDGDLMTDVAIYRTAWWAILFGEQGIKVTGTVVKTRGGNHE